MKKKLYSTGPNDLDFCSLTEFLFILETCVKLDIYAIQSNILNFSECQWSEQKFCAIKGHIWEDDLSNNW